ncbi:MAG: SLC13 family permease [Verrucomicrobia subdivision 3 bacterium]|nr:SLC13 family permease [Limisphaerales bacterium]
MTLEIALLLFIVVACLVLFSTDWVAPDVVALGAVVVLVVTRLVSPKEAFAGFGSETVIMILGLLLLTAALLRTGVMDVAAGYILRYTGKSENRLLVVVMLASAGLSAFMSNTASTAFFLPIVLGLAVRAQVAPGKLLLPLAFSSILTSSVTLISTSTNMVVSGLMTQYRLDPIGLFELSPVGIPIAITGLLYMYFIGRHLVGGEETTAPKAGAYTIRPYLSEIVVLPNSPLVGRTLAQSRLGQDLDLTVVRLIRGPEYLSAYPDRRIQANDILLAEGRKEEILKVKDIPGVEIIADVKFSEPGLRPEDLGLVEVILLPRSPLIGRTLRETRFRERFGLQVLGLNRHGENLRRKMSLVPLEIGDTMLIQGHRANIAALEDDNTFRVIGTLDEKRPHRKRAPMAVAIFVGVLLLATFKVLPLHVAVILGSVLAFVTRCITPDEAYREVEWKAVILIGSMLTLGAAMENTGTAKYLASLIVHWTGQAGPLWLLSGFFVLTVLLTQPMSNQAAAVVVIPIAIQTALQLDLNPRTFAMMIAVAASCSYLTPLEPSCLMVYGPGRYKFTDFLRAGSLLTLLIFLIAIYLVPRVWPLMRGGN